MNKREKKKLIKSILSKRLYHNVLPDEYQEDIDIIKAERQANTRIVNSRGYDIINDIFFVHEAVARYNELYKKEYFIDISKQFQEFDDYFNYLDGDIYENACYYQLDVSTINYDLDFEQMFIRDHFIDYTIDDYNASPTMVEQKEYRNIEKKKPLIKKWIDKFVGCSTYDSLIQVSENYSKSVLCIDFGIKVDFFLWQYTLHDLNDKNRFNVLMQYISRGNYAGHRMLYPLCHIFDPAEVLASYDYSIGSRSTNSKYKRRLKAYIQTINKVEHIGPAEVAFDDKTHYFYEHNMHGVYRYFETIDELLKYRKYDLSHTDLTKAIELDFDFSDCKMDETTKLPVHLIKDLKNSVKKYYFNGKFIVNQEWYSSNKIKIRERTHRFDYFFDFVAFLNGDLSGADLLRCEGLKRLRNTSGLVFNDTLIPSSICDSLAISYEPLTLDYKTVQSFSTASKNEKETRIVLQSSRELVTPEDEAWDLTYDLSKLRYYYASDIHLMHKLKNTDIKSKSDSLYVIQTIIDTIVNESGEYILLGGDISSDYTIFEIFVKMLRTELNKKRRHPKILFVLGNHELWQFPNDSIDSIVAKYTELLHRHDMILLHNNIYIVTDSDHEYISADEILSLNNKELRERVRTAKTVFWGGLGFSGYNSHYNADVGLYHDTIDRSRELLETEKFDTLYNKILAALPDKQLIVFTHMPLDCWHKGQKYHKNYIYVSGHTHLNYFYDDGETRIYADNQIGYSDKTFHMKWFERDNEFDYFADYADGIYEITATEYLKFCHGKNLQVTFTRNINVLYLLKKNGYYCFIHKSKNNVLTLLNGGSLKKLSGKDINYYYDKMDSVIAMIEDPLKKYTGYQEKVASEIKKIGGTGKIHGCIIDIDNYNHVYINPIDSKVTGYWAADITNKIVYSTIPALLEAHCPEIYKKYMLLLKGDSNNLPVLFKDKANDVALLPQVYLDTDIYRVSREIKKMQKLKSNILTTWYEFKNK